MVDIKKNTKVGERDILMVNSLKVGESISIQKLENKAVKKVEKDGKFGKYHWCHANVLLKELHKECWAWMPEIVADNFDKVPFGKSMKITVTAEENNGKLFKRYHCEWEGGSFTPFSNQKEVSHITLRIPSRINDLQKPMYVLGDVLGEDEKVVLNELVAVSDHDIRDGAKVDYIFFKEIMVASGIQKDEVRYKVLHEVYKDLLIAKQL